MNVKVKNKKMIASIFVLIIVALFAVFFVFNSKTLASDEVFNDIDFESEQVDVNGYKLDREAEEIYVKLKLSEEEKLAILEAIKNSRFEIVSSSDSYMDGNYFINISLNRLYELELDPAQKILMFVYEDDNDSDHMYYKFSNDGGLFELLETITK